MCAANMHGQTDFQTMLHTPSENNLTVDSVIFENQHATQVSTKAVTSILAASIQPHIPTNFNVDTRMSTGEIPINISVSPVGAVTANIPIDIESAGNGYQPDICLSYSSQSGNGLAGYGWNISGVSMINKIGKTQYFDAKTEGVTSLVTGDEAFSLDGNKLIIMENHFPDSIVFQTQQGHIRVTGYIKTTRVLQIFTLRKYDYFKVSYPNGNTAIFGTPNIDESILQFPIKKMSDNLGNEINYAYYYDNSYFRIKEITYGKQNKTKVSFQYMSRSDLQITYSAGVKITGKHYLYSITTGNRYYQLSHNVESEVCMLKTISCKAGDSPLNPLKFYYGNNLLLEGYKTEETLLSGLSYQFSDPMNIRAVKGQIDTYNHSDGLITLPNANPYFYIPNYDWLCFANQYSGNEDILIQMDLGNSISLSAGSLKTEKGFIDIFCADLDNQQGDEIIKVNNIEKDGYDQLIFQVYKPNNYGGITRRYTRTYNFSTLIDFETQHKSVIPKFYHQGDFNGDGRIDILAASTKVQTNETTVYLFDLENDIILYEGTPFDYFVQFNGFTEISDYLYPVDYDGDGKTDLLLVNNDGINVYTFYNDGTSENIKKVGTSSSLTKSYLAEYRSMFLGDFNGDIKTDLLVSPSMPNDTVWKIFFSTGNGIFETANISLQTTGGLYTQFAVQDMNGDGFSDLLQYDNKNNPATLKTFFITNSICTGTAPLDVPQNSKIILAHVLDRKPYTQLFALKNGILKRIAYNKNLSCERLLTGAVNSLGTVQKFDYASITEAGKGIRAQIYDIGYNATFPYFNFYGDLTVLSSTETYNNNVKINGCQYRYSNAIVHKQGLGFCGFERVTTLNTVRNHESYQTFDPFNFGVLKGNFSNEVEMSANYNFSISSNKIVKITLNNKTETNKLTNVTVTSNYTYDNYGNVLTENVDYGENIRTAKSITYNNMTATPYILGLPLTETTTNYRNEKSANIRKTYEYNAKGLPVAANNFYNTNYRISRDTLIYNSNWQIQKKLTKTYSATNWLGNEYEYYADGRLKKKIDPLGLYEQYYYSSLGRLDSVKLHNGLTTKYFYDNFGRQNKVIAVDGTIAETQTVWSSNVVNALYCITTTATGKPTRKTWYDTWGHELRSGSLRFDNSYLYVDKTYDDFGRLRQTSLPFKTSPARWNTYSYDSYDRIKTINYATGKTEEYIYSNNSVAVKVNGRQEKKTTSDPSGKVKTVEDLAGIISYNYRADGHPDSIVAPGNIITSFTYDNYGRQKSIEDPSAGKKTFAYDAAGNLNMESNQISQNVLLGNTFQYDTYNRLVYKNIQNMSTIIYTYDSNNRIDSIQSNNGIKIKLIYDNYGRLQTEKKNLMDNKWLQKTYNYSDGNINTITYSFSSGSNQVIEKFLYNNGTMYQKDYRIIADRLILFSNYWTLNKENEMGLPTTVNTGALTRTYGYNDYGMSQTRIVKQGRNVVQDFEYSFNPLTNNLMWRKDHKYHTIENFAYDDLYRLTYNAHYDNSATNANTSYSVPPIWLEWQNTYTYDEKGNITQFGASGTFEYNNSTKPYALTDVSPYSLSINPIPWRNQTVSYNNMMRPSSITENGYIANFTYDGDGGRVKMTLKKNGTDTLKRWYFDNYEIEQTYTGITERLYLGGDAYNASAILIKNGTNNWKIHYLCRDYQGNIMQITDNNGAVVQELSYNAWGQLRSPQILPDSEVWQMPTLLIGRGYTGHEHLPWFGLINMNARLYDPAVGRFLSPDPYIINPFNSQAYNRYTYGLNNPLMYSDPNGENPLLIIGIVAAFAYIVAAHENTSNDNQGNPLKWNWGFWNWFGGNNPNQPIVGISFGYGGGSGFYGNIIFGNQLMPVAVGMSQYYGYGIGGNGGMYYPSYQAKVNAAAAYQSADIGNAYANAQSFEQSYQASVEQGIFNSLTASQNDWVNGWLDRTSTTLTIGGYMYTGLERFISNSWFWVDAKGQIRSTNLLERGANGKYVNGIQGLIYGREYATRASGVYKTASRGLFYASVFVSIGEGYFAYTKGDELGVVRAGVDIGMSALSTYGGTPGLVIGGAYFVFDPLNPFYHPNPPYRSPYIQVPDNTYVAPLFKY
ncbi:hypothetical protein FACS189429_6260 [Bacteroidia bacterium]|nr:hypothetical protein FACS189429_6260 [Bacteroidia bacterium]